MSDQLSLKVIIMTGFSILTKLKDATDIATEHGFRLNGSRFGGDQIALAIDGDSLPIYSRDAELFCGSLEDITSFLRGVVWTKTYLKMLNVCAENDIIREENLYREKLLIDKLKSMTQLCHDK